MEVGHLIFLRKRLAEKLFHSGNVLLHILWREAWAKAKNLHIFSIKDLSTLLNILLIIEQKLFLQNFKFDRFLF